jgi:predicted DNA binding protein
VTRPTVFDRLVDYGVTVERFRVAADTAEMTVVIPPSGDVRQLIEALEPHYERIELVSRRKKSVREEPTDSLPDAVGPELTDRQYEVVKAAYLSGYFEWPRDSTGEEVAETLDITQPTFNRHLRTTEQKLFAALFGDSE